MSLNLFISSAVSPRGAIVASKANPVPVKFPDLVLGSVRSANLYIVDGIGGFDAVSGDASASVIAAIGTPGETPVWVNSSWTPIANGWSGQIAANNDAVAALFDDGINPVEVELGIQVTNALGNPVAYSNQLIKLWNRLIDGDLLSTNPFVNAGSGTFSIPNGVDTGTVTGLALSLIPRLVLPFVRKPAGGSQIFANYVDGTKSTDGFRFDLSGVTDSANYKLDYTLIY